MRKLIGYCLLLMGLAANAQELNCEVVLNTSQLKGRQNADPQVFSELETGIRNFMNNTRWTNDVFAPEERIKCQLVVTLLNARGQNVFSGRSQFQVLRPVYGTTYESIVFEFVDQQFEISFNPEDRQMVFNEQNFQSNLTSMLGFYALLGIAADYDSFSKLGGTEFVQRAYNVVNVAGSRLGGSPWTQQVSDRRSRYWLMDNFQNQLFIPFREQFYTYHRLILDDLANNPQQKRTQLIGLIEQWAELQRITPNLPLLNNFLDAKAVEIVSILSESPRDERLKAHAMLSRMNPRKGEVYRALTR